MTIHNTTKLALRYPDLAEPADLAALIQDLATDVDNVAVGYDIDTIAHRPAAGRAGFLFFASDTSTAYLDDGAQWNIIGAGNRVGLIANIPAANAVAVGTKYFATDQVVEFVSDGTNWIRTGAPAGATNIQLGAVADPGYILLQGQTWPAITGIYAALHTKLGGTNLPDFQQYVPVGRKAGDADFGTLLASGGEKTHVLTIAEMPSHTHTIPVQGSSGGVNGMQNGSLTGTQASGSTGGGGAHNNLQPYLVVNFQAKL